MYEEQGYKDDPIVRGFPNFNEKQHVVPSRALYTRVLLLALIAISFVPSASYSKSSVEPVRSMELCSHVDNVISYSSDCTSSKPALRINALHEDPSLTSNVLHLEIYSLTENIFYSKDVYGNTRLVELFINDHQRNHQKVFVKTLSGEDIWATTVYPIAELRMRGLIDLNVECPKGDGESVVRRQLLGRWADNIGKLSDGVKFDNRFTRYLEQYNFSVSELTFACYNARTLTRSIDLYLEEQNSKIERHERYRQEAEEKVTQGLETTHQKEVSEIRNDYEHQLNLIQQDLSQAEVSLASCTRTSEQEQSSLLGQLETCTTDLKYINEELVSLQNTQEEIVSRKVQEFELESELRHVEQMAASNQEWSAKQREYEVQFAEFTDKVVALNAQIGTIQEQWRSDVARLSASHAEQADAEQVLASTRERDLKELANLRENALNEQINSLENNLREAKSKTLMERLVFGFTLVMLFGGIFLVSFVKKRFAKPTS